MRPKYDTSSDKSLDTEVIPDLAPASISSSESSCGCSSSQDLWGLAANSANLPLPKVIKAVRTPQRVSFGQVSFRSYPVILGDHPDCLGPPLAFDWDYVNEEHYDLEDFEARRAPRKHDDELILDWFLRKRILRCYACVTEEELNQSSIECARIRRQREQTRNAVSLKSSFKNLLSKVSGGLLGDKALKHKDRRVHINRFKMKGNPATLVAASC